MHVFSQEFIWFKRRRPEARATSKVTANLQTRFRPDRFSEYPAESGSTGWEDGRASLGHLLHPGNLVIFTSFTKGEADSDLARLLAHCDHEVEGGGGQVRGEQHEEPQDWWQDMDVFYSNQLISVVKQTGN